MSHFAVIIEGSSPEVLLEPYWELNDLSQEELKHDSRAVFNIEFEKDGIEEYVQDVLKSKYVLKNEKLLKKYKTFYEQNDYAAIIDDWAGYIQNEDGDYGYYSNPDTKWDWYKLGGRWGGYFLLKPIDELQDLGADDSELKELGVLTLKGKTVKDDIYVDSALKKYIDTDRMRDVRGATACESYQRFLKEYYNDKDLTADRLKQIAHWNFGIENISQEEGRFEPMALTDYMNSRRHFAPFAFLSKKGWFEKGEMGWFCSVANEKSEDSWQSDFEQLWALINDDELVSLYDCHS